MRLQLTLAVLAAAAALGGAAHADGSVSARGVYYKERATRVMQPMLDSVFELGARGIVTAHFLVDAITSASASAGSAEAMPFTETRLEGGGSYSHLLEVGETPVRVGVEGRYSTEPDYKSFYAGARGEAELAQKNTTVGLGFGVGRDTIGTSTDGGLGQLMLVCEPGANETPQCALGTYAAFASVSQIVTRNAIVSASYDIVALRGYTANPYRNAIVGEGLEASLVRETHPTERLRQAYAVSGRYFFPQTETTLIAAYRYYRDNWRVFAHTPEVRGVQQIGDFVDATLRYRFHTQDKAFFYQERYPFSQKYVSDDVKLSTFTTHLVEAKLGIYGEVFELEGRWGGARVEAILSYMVQNNRFGNAITAHAALTVPFEY